MPEINRRAMLVGGAATLAAGPALAAAPQASTQGAGVYRMKLGTTQLTALYDGVWRVKIDDDFIRNADGKAVTRALAGELIA